MTTVETLIGALAAPETTDDAVERLHQLGAAALDGLLARMLDDAANNRVRELCAQAIGRVVPEGPRRLLAVLETAEGNAADLAAWGLRWHHGGEAVERALFELLTRESATIRANAARTLRYIHVDLKSCDPRLVAAAADASPAVRLDALRILCELAAIGLDRFGVLDVAAVIDAADVVPADAPATERALRAELLDRLRARRP